VGNDSATLFAISQYNTNQNDYIEKQNAHMALNHTGIVKQGIYIIAKHTYL